MNIVLPLWPYSKDGHFTELRYAMRSWFQYMPHDKIFVIGEDIPRWLKGVQRIAFRDDRDNRFRDYNIYAKLKYFIDNHARGEDFIYVNDDHFLLNNFTGIYYNKGSLRNTLNDKIPGDPYRMTISNTMQIIGADALDYDVHYPMIINCDLFREINLDWKKRHGYCMKSVYCRDMQDTTYPILDTKINIIPNSVEEFQDEIAKASIYFSTSDRSINEYARIALDLLYPNKSRYEI